MKKAEIWKDVPGYEGLYLVSSYGSVKSLDRIGNGKPGVKKVFKGKIIKPVVNYGGYHKVKLCKEGQCVRYSVHRLVAIAFIANPHNFPVVNHIDCNPSNNCMTNLEWCTYQHNSKHAYDNKRLIPPSPIKGLTNELSPSSKRIIQYALTGEIINEWPSIMEAERNGYNRGHISSCCSGKHKHHKGYLWSYKN